ncbi:MAG: sporulation protein [Oscillibacter sp.]|nr:sporulation protein [Oscillibacter sp.]
MKRKNWLLGLFLLAAMGCLLVESGAAAEAVRAGITLCVQSVIPALFPFFVLTSLFISLGFADELGRLLRRPARRLFHCGGAGGTAFLLGIVGGYPVGGRTVGQLYEQGFCQKQEAERLLACCNNSGPAFILGIAGGALFHSSRLGAWLYVIHVFSAVLTGLLLRPWHAPPGKQSARAASAAPPRFSQALIGAVQSGFSSILNVCGFVIFFLVVLTFFTRLTGLHQGAVLGLLELTNGILLLPPTPLGFCAASGLLAFGGLSVHCQTAAVLGGTGLSLRYYWLGKLLQTALSLLLSVPAALWLFS